MKKIIHLMMMLALIVPAFSYQSYASAAGETAALPAVLIQDTFDDEAGNQSLVGWHDQIAGSQAQVVAVPGSLTNQMLHISSSDSNWPTVLRDVPAHAGMDRFLIQQTVYIADASKFKTTPRFLDINGRQLGEVFYQQDGRFLLLAQGDTAIDIPGGGNIQSNHWYSLSVEINLSTKKITAWAGTRPSSLTYYDFKDNTAEDLNTFMYALQGVGDWQNKDTEGLSIDSLMLTALPQDYQYPVETGVPQSGLKLWLKADAGVAADADHRVSEWVNQAGSGKNAVQADPEHMPLLVQDSANNKPVLRFANHASSDENTTDQQASFMTSTGFATEDMSSYSVAFQIKPITLADYNQGINANQGTFIFHSNTAGGVFIGVDTDHRINAYEDPSNNGSLAVGRWDRVVFTLQGDIGSLYLNGQLLRSKAGLTMSQAWNDFNIGFNNAVYGLDADLSEILVYDRALSTQDIASLDTYMGERYKRVIPTPPEATPIPAPVEDPQLVYKEVLNDTFENAEGNSGLTNWQYSSSESQLQVENGNHVLEMKIKQGFPWPELSRSLEMGIGGIIKVQYKLKMDALGTFKIVPRLYGGDSGKEIGEVFYDQVNNRLVIRTKDKDTHVYDMPGGSQIQAGIWYDITMKVYMKEQVITAWVGDEPAVKTYAPFANTVDYFQRILFGLTGSDTPWGPQETGGIRVDDLHVTNAEDGQQFKELPYFSDIDQHPAKNDIEFLERKDVIVGSVDQTFHPDQPIQADEFIAWTVKALGFQLNAENSDAYIEKALSLGIVAAGEFDSYTRGITNGEMIRIAVRAANETYSTKLNVYANQIDDFASITEELKPYVLKAFSKGYITGVMHTIIDANGSASRSDGATILARVLDKNRRLPAIVIAQKLYVDALHGSDQNNGTLSMPFQTIQKARDFVRTINTDMNGDIVIYLRTGTFALSDTLSFGSEDSGTNGFHIVYKAYGQDVPQVSGGKEINDWEPAGNGLYKASALNLDFRQLYVNGVRATLARTPNLTDPNSFGPYNRITGWENPTDKDQLRIKIHANEIANWTGLQNVEMIINKHWDQSLLRLDSYEIIGDEAYITPKQPDRTLEAMYAFPQKSPNQSYYFQNSIDFLDAEGEFFLDKAANMVYYKPRAGEDMSHAIVVAPALEKLVDLNGAHDVQFENIVFEYSNWNPGSTGVVGHQGGRYFTTLGGWDGKFIPGGIQLQQANHITFQGVTVRHMGGTGIEFKHSTHDNVINGSTFNDIANNGVLIYSNTAADASNQVVDEALTSHDELISNNFFEHIGQIYTGSHGIIATYTSRTIIEHNEFVHLPYNAISVGWGWTDLETSLRDNRIQYNLIHDVMQLHDDSAGIYTLSYQPGTTITENWVHDIKRSEWAEQFGIGGIYLDEGSRSIRVERNVLMNVPEMIHLNTLRENQLIDNYHQYDWVKSFAGIQPYLKAKTYPDTEAPTLVVSLSPNELKAPNHKMVTIHAVLTPQDNNPGPLTIKLASITSNESGQSTGSQTDIQGAEYGTMDTTFELRSEKNRNGKSRMYTVTYTIQDAAGNQSTATATVTIGKDK